MATDKPISPILKKMDVPKDIDTTHPMATEVSKVSLNTTNKPNWIGHLTQTKLDKPIGQILQNSPFNVLTPEKTPESTIVTDGSPRPRENNRTMFGVAVNSRNVAAFLLLRTFFEDFAKIKERAIRSRKAINQLEIAFNVLNALNEESQSESENATFRPNDNRGIREINFLKELGNVEGIKITLKRDLKKSSSELFDAKQKFFEKMKTRKTKSCTEIDTLVSKNIERTSVIDELIVDLFDKNEECQSIVHTLNEK